MLDDVLLEQTADGVLPPMTQMGHLEDLGDDRHEKSRTDQQNQSGQTPDNAVYGTVDTFDLFKHMKSSLWI